MELTWQDIRAIVKLNNHALNSLDYEKVVGMGEEGYYTEILNQFKNQRI